MLSGASMAGPSNAMAKLGQTIAQIGNDQFGQQVKIARIENGRKMSEMKRKKQEGVAEFQNKIMQDRSIAPSKWGGMLQDHMKKIDLGKSKLSPEAQAQWQDWDAEYSSKQHLRVMRDATIAGIKDAKLENESTNIALEESGDFAGASENDRNSGVWSEVELNARQVKRDGREKVFGEVERRKTIETGIMNDPFNEEMRLDDDSIYPDLTDLERGFYKKKVARAKHLVGTGLASDIIDSIYSGQSLTDATIDQMANDQVDPKTVHLLKKERTAYLMRKKDPTPEQLRMLTVEGQNELLGLSDRVIDEYDPNGEAGDINYARAKTFISQIQNKYLQKEKFNELDAKRNGKDAEIKTIGDWMKTQAKEDVAAGVFGKATEAKQKVQTFRDKLDHGFFDNIDELESLGIDEGQIEDIMDEDSYADKVKMFQEVYAERPNQVYAEQSVLDLGLAFSKLKEGNLDSIYSEEDDDDSIRQSTESQRVIDGKAGALQREIDKFIKSQGGEINMKDAADFLKLHKVNIASGETDETWEAIPERPEGFLPSYNPAESEFNNSELLNYLGDVNNGGAGNVAPPIIDLPTNRGVVDPQTGSARGLASTYWGDGKDDNGMTSVGISRSKAPWFVDDGKPTVALAPETAKAMGLSLPKKQKDGTWDTSNSELVVTIGMKSVTSVYAENGMYKNPASFNKLVDLSEQFQDVAGVKKGETLKDVRIRKITK
jgi:hypothetical protein